VNVPAISIWEWHPFSLCSSPLDASAQMCIKNMGPGTFTSKLHALAKRCNDSGSSFVLNVDGPYGPHLDPRNYAGMLLLAGGIGITPMHSTFRMLSQLARQNELPDTLKSVRLVWIARSEDLFSILMDSLKECVQSGRIEAELYVDNPAQPQGAAATAPTVPGLIVVSGRPSFDELYDKMSREVNQGAVLVKACGPPPMDAAAERSARSRKTLTYESELFVL
jgi:NADPH oxidase